MAYHAHTQLLAHLQTFLPPELITTLARKHGWFRRDRKLDPVVMVWTLILGFSTGARRSIATLHRSYLRHSGADLTYSAFRRRFDADLAATMTSSASSLGPFQDILALDATIVRACGMRSHRSSHRRPWGRPRPSSMWS